MKTEAGTGEIGETAGYGGGETGETANHRCARVVDLDSVPLKELLLYESSRTCNNIPMIAFFWAHVIAVVALIIYVMSHDSTAETSSFLEDVVLFLAERETGQKLFGVMIGTCITGSLFAMCWIWFLRYFQDQSIKVSIIIAHLIVFGLAIWAIVDNVVFFCCFLWSGAADY